MTVSTDPRKTGITVGPTLLAASAVAVSVTGTTAETALATVTIPAGAMGLNGAIEVRSSWTHTNSANAKSLRVRLGGIAGTAFLALSNTAAASVSDMRRIRNRGAANSQVGSCAAATTTPVGSSGNALVTGAVDTSAAQDIVISGQLALNTETITLESYEVWLLP